jgi:hypothetical protein
MPLSRHLYELDEVTSALQTCLRKRWPRAHFWLWELLQSEEYDMAASCLQNAWILYGAPADPTILTADQPTDQDSWIDLFRRIERAIERTKGSAVAFMMARTHEITLDTAVTKVGAWASLRAAAQENKRRLVLRILEESRKFFTDDEIDTALKNQYDSEDVEIRKALQGLAALALCPPESNTEIEKDTLLPHYRRTWASWAPLIGTRKGRVYEIPTEALTPTTTRGALSTKYTNIGELRDPVPSLFEGCAWWRSQLEKIGATQDDETGAVVFPNDDVLESFYATHFSDDIPDEWSLEDQQKSHGRGRGIM